MKILLEKTARLEPLFINLIRLSIFIVMAWIGGLKFVHYEADGIVPFVANSPVMSFVYSHPAPEYRTHLIKEGEYNAENFKWQVENRTYLFSDILGTTIVGIGILMLLGIVSARIGFLGAALTVGMSVVTLSFLVTTPEAWVPNLGAGISGFPYLAGPGRLVVKDLIMIAGALVCLSNSAKALIEE